MSDVVEIRDPEALQQYSADWSALHAQTPDATLFQTLEWLTTYLRFFGADQQLRCLIVLENGTPTGIVPLVVRREPYRVATPRVLTYPLDDWGTRFAPLGSDPLSVLGTACCYLAESPRDWDLVDLKWVEQNWDQDSSGRWRTEQAMREAGWFPRDYLLKHTAVVDTSMPWQAYLASRQGKFRSDIRRAARLVAKQGEVEYSRWRPAACEGGGDPRFELFAECVAVAEKSWQGDSSSGTTLSHVQVTGFLRAIHQVAAELGMLDINLLRVDGRVAAFAYNYHHAGQVCGLRVGFDPAFSKAGIGKHLWARSLENSCERGDVRYDLGAESMHIKRNWLTEIVPIRGYLHYSSLSARSQLVRLSRWWRAARSSPGDFAASRS